MTYRDAPLRTVMRGVAEPLIATAEHSVLGTRWIYDGLADPVWLSELVGLVASESVSEPSSKRGVGPAQARGLRLLTSDLAMDPAIVNLIRVVTVGGPVGGPGVAGVVMGSWHPDGPDTAEVSGCLAVVRESASGHQALSARAPSAPRR
jgi:hypothetical protein